jgi:hypothetical protein
MLENGAQISKMVERTSMLVVMNAPLGPALYGRM